MASLKEQMKSDPRIQALIEMNILNILQNPEDYQGENCPEWLRLHAQELLNRISKKPLTKSEPETL